MEKTDCIYSTILLLEKINREGYIQKDLTVGAGKANAYALFFAFPFIVLFTAFYALFWFEDAQQISISAWVETYQSIINWSPAIFALVLIGGVVVHELIHGLTWALFAPTGYQSISYGIMWRFLTPYCHCQEPLLLNHYRLGGVMPALVMGFLPAIYGMISGNLSVFILGLWFTMAAGGDFLILWMLRNTPKESLVQDHPDKIGCFVLEKNAVPSPS